MICSSSDSLQSSAGRTTNTRTQHSFHLWNDLGLYCVGLNSTHSLTRHSSTSAAEQFYIVVTRQCRCSTCDLCPDLSKHSSNNNIYIAPCIQWVSEWVSVIFLLISPPVTFESINVSCKHYCASILPAEVWEVDPHENHHQMSYSKLKCTQLDFGWGSAPDPSRSLQRSTRLPSWI